MLKCALRIQTIGIPVLFPGGHHNYLLQLHIFHDDCAEDSTRPAGDGQNHGQRRQPTTSYAFTTWKRQVCARGGNCGNLENYPPWFDYINFRFGLFLRLFIVMGVTWAMEVISWIIDPESWVFYLSDACNSIQGLLIFILFVMKPKVKKLLLNRYVHIFVFDFFFKEVLFSIVYKYIRFSLKIKDLYPSSI